jgi:hypothetical protein
MTEAFTESEIGYLNRQPSGIDNGSFEMSARDVG